MNPDEVEHHRSRLLAIAYRILGSMNDAEDVVQEALLRWYRNQPHDVRSPEAWLTTVTTRLSIDRLRARRKEHYEGPWLPEPVASDFASNPEMRAVAQEDLSIAFLSMLERLSPEERAAFVLREAFAYSYHDISAILERRPDACRQLVHRAKAAMQSDRTKYSISWLDKEHIVRRFLDAMESSDELSVLKLVDPNSHWVADGGGKVVGAATRILHGHDRVSRMAIGVSRKFAGKVTGELIHLLGEPAIAWKFGTQVYEVTVVDSDGQRIQSFYNILNPDKLRHVYGQLNHSDSA